MPRLCMQVLTAEEGLVPASYMHLLSVDKLSNVPSLMTIESGTHLGTARSQRASQEGGHTNSTARGGGVLATEQVARRVAERPAGVWTPREERDASIANLEAFDDAEASPPLARSPPLVTLAPGSPPRSADRSGPDLGAPIVAGDASRHMGGTQACASVSGAAVVAAAADEHEQSGDGVDEDGKRLAHGRAGVRSAPPSRMRRTASARCMLSASEPAA